MAPSKAFLADVAAASDADLAKLDAKLADERTDLRERQVAVANEIESRRVTANLSPTQRIALAHHLAAASSTTSEKA
jgi:hypothetical protein